MKIMKTIPKKRKLDPKIIRVGDTIRINNPEMFVRCGYPLCLKDMQKEISDNFGEAIENLIYSIGKGDELLSKKNDPNYKLVIPHHNINGEINQSKTYQKVIKALCYERLISKKFGGNERRIYTQRVEESKGRLAEVTAIRFRKTGNRVSPSGGYDRYTGEYDYEPGYLDNEKTHKIISLYFKDSDILRKLNEYDNEIEAIHVTKIIHEKDICKKCMLFDCTCVGDRIALDGTCYSFMANDTYDYVDQLKERQ